MSLHNTVVRYLCRAFRLRTLRFQFPVLVRRDGYKHNTYVMYTYICGEPHYHTILNVTRCTRSVRFRRLFFVNTSHFTSENEKSTNSTGRNSFGLGWRRVTMVRYGRRNGDALSGPKSSISCEGGEGGSDKARPLQWRLRERNVNKRAYTIGSRSVYAKTRPGALYFSDREPRAFRIYSESFPIVIRVPRRIRVTCSIE